MVPSQDEPQDPLTAASWPVEEGSAVLDPSSEEVTEQDDSDAVKLQVPKPPDVDAILRGDYTGWVPVIKAVESLVDATERANARIRRIEAEIDAQETTGARSVSMWMQSNTGAVPLNPVTQVPPTSAAPAVTVIPGRPSDPATPAGQYTSFVPDPDQVLSPGDALEEARRRIRQMREDLENNVSMVSRTFDNPVFSVPTAAQEESRAEEQERVVEVVEFRDESVAPAPVVHEHIPDTEHPSVVIELHHEESVGLSETHITDAVIISETVLTPAPSSTKSSQSSVVESQAVQTAEEKTPEPPRTRPSVARTRTLDEIADAIEALIEESSEATPEGQDEYQLAMSRLARTRAAVGIPAVDDEVEVDGADESDSAKESSLAPDLAPVTALDENPVAPVPVAEPVAAPITMAPSVPPFVVAPGTANDSEAKFLSDLLGSLEEVEAAVTAVVNTTALDDVLEKYKDILETDTSSIPKIDVNQAHDLQAKAAETRHDLDEMIRNLKAAADTFADQTVSDGVVEAAAVIEGILSAAGSGSETEQSVAPSSPVHATNGVPSVDPAAAETHTVSEVSADETTADSTGEPDLFSLVDTALKPISLPTIFQGEPKRMTVDDQLAALRDSAVDSVTADKKPAAGTSRAHTPAAPAVVPQAPTQPAPSESVSTESLPPESLPPEAVPAAKLPPKRASKAEPTQPSSTEQPDATRPAARKRAVTPVTQKTSSPTPAASGTSFWDEEDAVIPHPVAAVAEPEPAQQETATTQEPEQQSVYTPEMMTATASTVMISEQAPKDHSLELVIMRDEIRDLRDRLDSAQRLIEDLMLRLANLTEIALRNRSN